MLTIGQRVDQGNKGSAAQVVQQARQVECGEAVGIEDEWRGEGQRGQRLIAKRHYPRIKNIIVPARFGLCCKQRNGKLQFSPNISG
jgi:hypothetical protein